MTDRIAGTPPIIFDRNAKKWRVTLAGCDFFFPHRGRATAFICAYAEQAKCLYHECWEVGFEGAHGRGFRFCAEHAAAFRHIHTHPIGGQHAQAS